MGADGGAIHLSYSTEAFGDFDFSFSYGSSKLSNKEAKLLLGEVVMGTGKQKFDAQASFFWQPTFSSWRFGLSLLDSDFKYQRNEFEPFANGFFSFQQYGLSALYEGEYWQFSSEIYQQKFLFEGFYFPGFKNDSFSQGAYIQSRYQHNDKLNLLVRLESFFANKDDRSGRELEKLTGGQTPRHFAFQHDLTLGASYHLSEKLRLQLEFHQIKGTSRLTPITFPNTKINNNEYWNLWALQLMYWF
jgi:hypothetical protein